MLTNSVCLLSAGLWVTALSAATLEAASYAISSTGKTELVGTSSDIPGGGESSNFSSDPIEVGTTYASFQLVSSGTSTRFADMRVTLVGVDGTLDTSGGSSGLMIAQTSNSQGLTDSGTLSVLTDFSDTGSSGESSITLRFDFFQPDTLTPMAVPLELTSFDLDYQQFMRVPSSDISAEAHGSKLTMTSADGFITWADTANSDATFAQSTNAVVLNNVPDESFEITMGKIGTGNSLFVFEFRDPSEVLDAPLVPTPIPEPSSGLALALSLCMCGLIRHRTR